MGKEAYKWEIYFAYQDHIYDKCIDILVTKENGVNFNQHKNILEFTIILEKELNIDLSTCNTIEFALLTVNNSSYKECNTYKGKVSIVTITEHAHYWKHKFRMELSSSEIKTYY